MGQHGKHRPLVGRAAALAALIAAPAWGAECRLALALAMDVSSSVDALEYSLQRNGTVSALISPEVEAAFFASDLPVALAIYEWSGRYNQALVLDWKIIDSRKALVEAAEVLSSSIRSHNEFPTAMGYALGYGAELLKRGPDCLRRVIDMAGDGQNNEGFPPGAAYREFPFAGVTVNGLVVNAADFEGEVGLIAFYRGEVLFGPGAFLEIADGFEDFERAMRRKLERELTPPVIGALPLETPSDG